MILCSRACSMILWMIRIFLKFPILETCLPLTLCRLLLKQLMEVIQWNALWNTFKEEFENEKNMCGGSLGDKAAEDLKQRNILVVSKYYSLITLKTCRSVVSHDPGSRKASIRDGGIKSLGCKS